MLTQKENKQSHQFMIHGNDSCFITLFLWNVTLLNVTQPCLCDLEWQKKSLVKLQICSAKWALLTPTGAAGDLNFVQQRDDHITLNQRKHIQDWLMFDGELWNERVTFNEPETPQANSCKASQLVSDVSGHVKEGDISDKDAA